MLDSITFYILAISLTVLIVASFSLILYMWPSYMQHWMVIWMFGSEKREVKAHLDFDFDTLLKENNLQSTTIPQSPKVMNYVTFAVWLIVFFVFVLAYMPAIPWLTMPISFGIAIAVSAANWLLRWNGRKKMGHEFVDGDNYEVRIQSHGRQPENAYLSNMAVMRKFSLTFTAVEIQSIKAANPNNDEIQEFFTKHTVEKDLTVDAWGLQRLDKKGYPLIVYSNNGRDLAKDYSGVSRNDFMPTAYGNINIKESPVTWFLSGAFNIPVTPEVREILGEDWLTRKIGILMDLGHYMADKLEYPKAVMSAMIATNQYMMRPLAELAAKTAECKNWMSIVRRLEDAIKGGRAKLEGQEEADELKKGSKTAWITKHWKALLFIGAIAVTAIAGVLIIV